MNFLIAFALLAAAFLIGYGAQKNAAQRIAERLEVARLRRHADEEDELVQDGDMAGVYGEFPPPPGMWTRNIAR